MSRQDWVAIGQASGWHRTAEFGADDLLPPKPKEVKKDTRIKPLPAPLSSEPIVSNPNVLDDNDERLDVLSMTVKDDHNKAPNFNFGPVGNKVLTTIWFGETDCPRVIFGKDIPDSKFDEFFNQLFDGLKNSGAYGRPYSCTMDATSKQPAELAKHIENVAKNLQNTMIKVVGVYSSPEIYKIFKDAQAKIQPDMEKNKNWFLIQS